MPERKVQEVHKFICDKSDLPLKAENGHFFHEEVCGEEITWQDTNYYGCDTSYLLYLSIFDPEVNLTQECGSCDGSISLKANVDYSPKCNQGKISWTGYWLNNLLDTISMGEELNDVKEGAYYFVLHVKYVDLTTNKVKECDLEGLPPWLIIARDIDLPAPQISGVSTICDKGIGTYQIDNSIEKSCEYNWKIKKGDGVIKTTNHIDSTIIQIEWKGKNESAEVCVSVKTDCGLSPESCFEVIFNNSPNFTDIEIECNEDKTSYRILFKVIGGEESTTIIKDTLGWSVIHLDSTSYTSPWIKNGDRSFIQTFDQYRCHISVLDTIFDCMDVAVNNLIQNEFNIYPNPTHNFIQITRNNLDNNLNEMYIKIIDIQGKEILSPPKTSISGGIKVNVEKLPPGMYFIQLKKGDKNEVVKFVKI